MRRRKKKKSKLSKVKFHALNVIAVRKELAPLIELARKTDGGFSKKQAAHAVELLKSIEAAKKAIATLGFEPAAAIRAAAAEQRRQQQRPRQDRKGKKMRATPKKAKRGGLGMYALGNSLKVWR